MNPRRLLVFDHTALLALLDGHATAHRVWDEARADRLIMAVPALALPAVRVRWQGMAEHDWDAPLWPAVVMPLDRLAATRLPLDYFDPAVAHAALEAEMVRGMVVTADPDLYHDKLVPLYVLDAAGS